MGLRTWRNAGLGIAQSPDVPDCPGHVHARLPDEIHTVTVNLPLATRANIFVGSYYEALYRT